MFDKNLMKLSGMRPVMAALVVFALLQATLIAAQTFALCTSITLLWEGSPVPEATGYIVCFGIVFAVRQVVEFAEESMLERSSLKQAQALRSSLLEKAFSDDGALSRSLGPAHLASLASERIDEIQTYARIIAPKMISIAAVSVPLLAVEFASDWVSGIILAIMFPVIIFFMVLLGKQARSRAEVQYASYTLLTSQFIDTLKGLPVIRALRAAPREASAVFANSEQVRRATVRTLTTATLSSAVLDLCATFGVAAVAMMLAFRIMDGSVSLFTGLFALVLAPEYFMPIRSFANDYHASLDGKNALGELLSILEKPAFNDDAKQPDRAYAIAPWNAGSSLAIDDVSYHYPNSLAGIEGISFEAKGFERIGIVGKSGSGKSTLASIAAGFLTPEAGTTSIDGVACALADDSWREQVRYVTQQPYIFHASLEDNIRFYCPAATADQVRDVVRSVGLDKLVSELPCGLSSYVGEGGRGLSGGEAHRVALARILLDERARVLVFDEPTAHLDIETEAELKEPMLKAMEGRLVFFATHRAHWLSDMDKVIVLEDGCIAGLSSEVVA